MYYIDESIINEHIPRDLLAAYKKSDKYNSANHELTDHDSVNSNNRRSVNYKYGNATYKVISADEALDLIRQDPANIHYIRGIKDGDLVEYEYKGGNKFYNVYGNPNKEISYVGRNGEIQTKRNIRYITNPKAWIPLLDKIYWTDEYDYPVSDTENSDRDKKSNIHAISSYAPISDAEFSQFKPFDHLTRNTKMLRQDTPDSGHHAKYLGPDGKYYTSSNFDRYFRGTRAHYSNDSANIVTSVRTNPQISETIVRYLHLLVKKKQLFAKYSHLRKALRKLARDRDDYDEDEYNELFERWKEEEKLTLNAYNDAALNLSRIKTQLDKYYDSVNNEFSNKYAEVIHNLQNALERCISLKSEIDQLKSKALDGLTSADMKAGYNSTEHNIINSIKNVRSQIVILIKQLDKLKSNAQEIESNAEPSKDAEIEDKISQIKRQEEALDNLRKSLISSYLKRYRDLHKEMLDIEQKVNALKPTRAARKAAKAQAAGKAILDPALTNIIQFEDEEIDETSEEQTA